MPWENGEFVYKTGEETETSSKQETKTGRNTQEDQPYANQPEVGLGIAADHEQIYDNITRETGENAIFDRLMNSPEILSIMQAVVDDVLGPGATFTYIGREDGDNNGRESVRQAKKFWRRNQNAYGDSMIDNMAVGDMYLYKRRNDEAQAAEQVKSVIKDKYDFNFKASEEIATQVALNEIKENTNMFELKELKQIPASTVEHEINQYGDIVTYKQDVGGNTIEIPHDQVIHDSFMSLNGKTYGFTPFISLLAEIDMLANAKDHNAVHFDNAAVPNKLFKLVDEGPSSANFEMVKETLEQYRKMKNKHRDLVLTGDIEVEDLNSAGDMEFRELAEYVTRTLVMAWGVPPTRVGVSIGGGRGRMAELAHEGYYKRIIRMQRRHEALLNEHLFEPVFNVRISFNSPDTKTEIRMAERDLRRTETVRKMAGMGMMNKQAAMEYLDVNKHQVFEDMSDEEFQQAALEAAGAENNFLSNTSINEGSASEAENANISEGQGRNVQRDDV